MLIFTQVAEYTPIRAKPEPPRTGNHGHPVLAGQRYVYLPAVPREAAKKSAIQRLISTFFDGSAKAAAAAFLDPASAQLSEEDLKELEGMIRGARKEKS